MDEEFKKGYLRWDEKGSKRVDTRDVIPTFQEVDAALLECERQLNEVGLGTGYTSIASRLGKLVEDRETLYQYIWSLLYYIESKIDKPLKENFRLNATERISRIRLEDFEVDNTLGLTEAVYPFGSATPIKQEKVKLSFCDFTGTMAGELKLDGFSYSRTNGCIEEFSEIFVGQYEALRIAGLLEAEITWEEYTEQFLEQGTFYHDGSTGFKNFVSSVLDITIIKPIIEAYIGEDLITGEDLTEMERGLKVVFAAIDLITLGGAIAATELGEVGLKEGLKWMGKTATIEFASNTVACGVGTLGEELGWPMAVTMLFSFAFGLIVNVNGTDVIFKGADERVIRQLDLKDVTADGKAYIPEELGDILKKQGIAVEVDATGNTIKNIPEIAEQLGLKDIKVNGKEYTPEDLLDVLKKQGIAVEVDVTGNKIKNTPEVAKDILEEVPEVVIEGGSSSKIGYEYLDDQLGNLKDKVKINQYQSAESVNAWWEARGYKSPYKEKTVVQNITLTEDTKFVRVYDGVNSNLEGGWVMRAEDIKGLTPKEIQAKFALEYEPKFIGEVELKAGDTVRLGEVGPNFGFDGGGIQIDLQQQWIGDFTELGKIEDWR